MLTTPRALDSELPRDPSLSFNHLRRFSRRDALPEHLRAALKSNPTPNTIFVLVSPPLPDIEPLQRLLAPFAPPPEDTGDTPQTHSPDPSTITLYPVRIPLLAPLNHRQAESWTKSLWPVVFNPSAPRATVAAPPQIVNRVRDSIRSTAGHYLALAESVAEEAELSGRGRRVGAVVVDPAIRDRIVASGCAGDADQRWLDAVVAVAGDARYSRREGGAPALCELQSSAAPNPATQSYDTDLEGGPELHALMRAADLVASKRREIERDSSSGDAGASANTDSPHLHLTPLESHFLSLPDPQPLSASCRNTNTDQPPDPDDDPAEPEDTNPDTTATATRIRPRAQGGYLCIDLDIYVSREPCLCCSMGMLLSRFRAVVFPLKGRLRTGGLASEAADVVRASGPASLGVGTGGDVLHASCSEQVHGKEDASERETFYGLHWRKELNWRALGFEFVEDGTSVESDGEVFHA